MEGGREQATFQKDSPGNSFSCKYMEHNSTGTHSVLNDGGSPLPIRHHPHPASQYYHQHGPQRMSMLNSARDMPQMSREMEQMGPDPGQITIKYREIERILKSENKNLQEQNNLLLLEINKLRTTNKRYKNIDQMQRLELQQLQEECEAQKRRAQELKDMIMTRMSALEQKVQDGGDQKDSFLEILELSKGLSQ